MSVEQLCSLCYLFLSFFQYPEMTETYLSLTFMILYDLHFPFPYQPPHFHIRTDLNSVQRPRAIWVGKPAPRVELTTDSDDSIGIGKILEVCI